MIMYNVLPFPDLFFSFSPNFWMYDSSWGDTMQYAVDGFYIRKLTHKRLSSSEEIYDTAILW